MSELSWRSAFATKVKGTQYSDQLFLRTVCSIGDPTSLISVPIQVALPPTHPASLNDNIPSIYGNQSYTYSSTEDSTYSIKLWSNEAQTLKESMKVSPSEVKLPYSLVLKDWRLLPTSDELLFQQYDDSTNEYITQFTTKVDATIGGNSLLLSNWRIIPSQDKLLFEKLDNATGEYELKATII